jgi:hypothetical protein
MPNNFSVNAHYYVLLFLFAVLFILQIWALLKIKRMFQSMLQIYGQMQQIAAGRKTGPAGNGPAQPSAASSVNYRRICQYCRFRETFLDASGVNVFFYQCGLSKHKIKLDDSCQKFEFDPQRAEI